MTNLGIRTSGEAAPLPKKRNQENENGGELKKLRAQVENLSRALKGATSGQAASSNQPYYPPPEAPAGRKGKGKAKGKGKGGHQDEAKARALTEFKAKEQFERFLPGGKTMVCSFYQTNSCTNGNRCQYAHVCLRCHKPGHTCLDGTCTAAPRLR